MYRFIAVISFIFLFNVAAGAQQLPDAEFGVIPDSLFQMRQPLQNADAPYIITNKEVDVTFTEDDSSIVAVIEHHTRLKIFDKRAREASIISIPYYFDNNMERISGIKAATYLPSGEQIPLKEKEIKTINLNARYNVKEFTMPGVEDGAVLEYKYTIRRRYIEELPDFYLSHTVPTAVAKLTITYPPYLRYKIFLENYDGPVQHGFTRTDTSSVPRIFTIPRPPPILTEHWVAYDVPAVEDEPFVPSLNDYRGKIKFLMSEFGLPRQPLENSWRVVVARLREKSNPMRQVRQNELAKSIGDSIARANRSLSKKAVQDSIYRFLNEKINFSGTRSPFSETPDSVVLSGKASGQAAINQTLLAMLRGAGVEAYPVFVSTRSSGTINKGFPSFYQFNAMLVQSRINGETYIMDASMAFSQPGLIPVEMNNTPGLLLKPNSFEWVKFQPEKSVFDIQVEVDAELQSNGTLSGTITAVQKGYPAQIIRQQKADGASEKEIFKRMLLDGFLQLTTENVQIKNLDEYGQPIKITGQFTIERYAASFSDGLRFRPMLVGALPENPFENKNRDLPVTLDAPEELDVSYSISLPPNYSLKKGNQNHTLSLPGAELAESYSTRENELDYEFHIDINRTHFSTA
ncbi:MAG TPA: DUF3857 domain-containing protein, partial [Balneolaceae bacterium]|nr:DUF3857 domain-containing protein [Balneolaceae bacterium]